MHIDQYLRFSFIVKSEKFVKVYQTVNVKTIFGMWNDDNEEIIGTLYLMLQHSYQSSTALHVMDAHATEKNTTHKCNITG